MIQIGLKVVASRREPPSLPPKVPKVVARRKEKGGREPHRCLVSTRSPDECVWT
jgi:hypothetical protein